MKRFLAPLVIFVAALALAFLAVRGAVNAPDEGGLTPLHFAALVGDEGRAALLLAAGARHDGRTPDGQTPLHLAASPEVVAVLHRRGADLNARAGTGDTPLHLAALGANAFVAQRLVSLGADVHARNEAGETPLHLAVQGGDTATVALLLSHGADPRLPDAQGRTPLQRAQRRGKEGITRMLARAAQRAPAE